MKSYYVNSVQIAMEEARRELGGDAILVTSRLAPAEAGKARQYEVVFATEIPANVSRETPISLGSIDSVLKEVREIRSKLESPKQNIAQPDAKELFALLTKAEVDPDLAQELLASAMKRTPVRDLRAAAAAEIRDVFRAATGFEDRSDQTTIAALIGPPGAGKTAAIAKLAVRYGLKLRRPTLLISADTSRVAASEQLRSYASLLGLRFELAPSARALGQILEDHRGTELVLIDSPGFSAHELNQSNELARFFAGRTDIQKHLVLQASARGSDIRRVSSAYEIFKPSHLIFSRVDETNVFGPVLSEAMGSGRPVSFFTTGQRVPEDIEEASAETLIGHILPVSTPQHRMAAAA